MATNTKHLPKANKIIASGLKVVAKEVTTDDVRTVAKITGKHENTINLYLKGDVRDFNTGSVFLTEFKKLISDREQYALELVA